MGTITSANSVYMISVIGLFPLPQQLQGYAADDAFDTAPAENSEVVIGVDGKISAGYVPFLTDQTIHLQPDSPSISLFQAWLAAEKAAKEKFYAAAIISLPSIARKYVCTDGVLKSTVQIPTVKKLLQPQDFIITWGSIDPAPFGL